MKHEFLDSINIDELNQSENNIILIGFGQNDTTTLQNKLCDIKEEESSDTINVKFAKDPYQNIIIDIPSINEDKDTIVNRLKIQKYFFSSIIDIKMICLVIKLTPRYDDMVRDACYLIPIFDEYKQNISIIITNSENATKQSISEIKYIFEKKFKIEQKNVIFSSNLIGAEEIREKLNEIKKEMQNIKKIKINLRHLLNAYRFDGDLDFIEEREKFLDEYKEKFQKFKNGLIKTSNDFLKIDLGLAFIEEKNDLIKRFYEIINKKSNDVNKTVFEVISFNNEIFGDFYKIINEVFPKYIIKKIFLEKYDILILNKIENS